MVRPRYVVLLATGVVVGAAIRRRRERGGDVGPIPVTGQVERVAGIAQHVVRVGGGTALHQARRVFVDAERRDAYDAEHQLQTVEQVAVVLGDLKGALMKLGQMASFLDPEMAPEYRHLLARLQHDVPPMAPELAAGVVAEELGARPEVVFAEWDAVPIAAASIGQVHRAMTHDGRAVAVKVQYPGVDDAIRSDLNAAGILFRSAQRLFPGVDAKRMVGEIRERIIEELDYRLEADNQERFATAYADHPHIHIPRVHRDLSARRVLTSDLVVGHRMDEAVGWSQDERDLAGETIYRFVFSSLYRMQAFNGDPHPGNYLFHRGGRVTFLDFGMVKSFTSDQLHPFERMVRAHSFDRDLPGFRRAAEDAGFVPSGLDQSDEDILDYLGAFFDLAGTDEPLELTPAYARSATRRLVGLEGDHPDLVAVADVPKDLVILQRIHLGVVAILAQLHATANWHRLSHEWWPWADGVPHTDLGRADDAWRGARAARA